MNHCVPDFEIDDDYAIPSTSAAAGSHVGALTSTRTKKIAIGDEEDIMELLWQNGQVVLQSQNQRSSLFKKSPNGGGGGVGAEAPEIAAQQAQTTSTREIRSFENVVNRPPPQQQQPQLFMQEDEMASWLHYPIPIDDSSFAAYTDDLLYSAPSSPPREIRSIVTDIRPLTPPPPPRPPPEAAAPKFHNFTQFSRLSKAATATIAQGHSAPARELTVVDSNDTPAARTESRVSGAPDGDSTSPLVSGCHVGCGTTSACSTHALGTSTAARELATVTSSPVGSGGSAGTSDDAPRMGHNPSTAEGRKRKGRETDDTDGQSEDVEFESADTKKQARGSTSAKRSRAAEVHNLSERRRRDRINERMRALQELIPRCNKSDKASMLDEAIEYLKSLQLQVQMMSMGCVMIPLMYPGVQQYMPAMGMGMGMEMGMNRPIMPYPPLMSASGIPNPALAANMGPRFPVSAFHMQPVPIPDSSRIHASNQLDPVLNSLVTHNPNQPRMPNFTDPYQQFIGLHQAQVPLPQNQVAVPPSKPSSSRGVGNPDNNKENGAGGFAGGQGLIITKTSDDPNL